MRLAPGLHRLGNGLVNSYLVADGDGVTDRRRRYARPVRRPGA